jgi:hypothetical protein
VAAQDIIDQIERLASDDPAEYSKLIQLIQWRVAREHAEELEVLGAVGTAEDARRMIDHERHAHEFAVACEVLRDKLPGLDLDEADTINVLIAEDAYPTLVTLAHRTQEIAQHLQRIEFDDFADD